MQVRLEMAKFLQETISETGFPGSADPKAAQEFADFFRKVKKKLAGPLLAFVI